MTIKQDESAAAITPEQKQPQYLHHRGAPMDSEFIKTVKDLTAGTIGGCAGIIVGQPLDTIKVRMQSQGPTPRATSTNSVAARAAAPGLYNNAFHCFTTTVRLEGYRALFKGLQSPLIGNAPINAIVFGAYGNAQRLLDQWFPRAKGLQQNGIADGEEKEEWTGSEPVDLMRIGIASTWAGFVQTSVATPIELIKCRLQVQNAATSAAVLMTADTGTAAMASSASSSGGLATGSWASRAAAHSAAPNPPQDGVIAMSRHIIRKHGVLGLYRGWVTTMLRDTPGFACYFLVYEYCKYVLSARDANGKASISTMLISGSLAGLATWASTYPLDVIKSIVQTLPDSEPKHARSMRYIIQKHVALEGWRFFLRGIGPTLLRAVPTNAATFLCYEFSLKALNE